LNHCRSRFPLAPPATTQDALKLMRSRQPTCKNSSRFSYAAFGCFVERAMWRVVYKTRWEQQKKKSSNTSASNSLLLHFREFSFVFFLVSLFPCFLSGSHSFDSCPLQHILSSAGRSLSIPYDLKVLRPFSTTTDPSRQSLRPYPQQTPLSIRQYACPQLRSHAFEQDVLGRSRLAGPLHDSCYRHHVQLCPDDRHHWC
jgi:hypothetical protein